MELKPKWAIRKYFKHAFCIIIPGSKAEVPMGECFGKQAEENAQDIVDAMNRPIDVEANELLRSAYQIAKRKGKETNWEAFEGRVKEFLEKENK